MAGAAPGAASAAPTQGPLGNPAPTTSLGYLAAVHAALHAAGNPSAAPATLTAAAGSVPLQAIHNALGVITAPVATSIEPTPTSLAGSGVAPGLRSMSLAHNLPPVAVAAPQPQASRAQAHPQGGNLTGLGNLSPSQISNADIVAQVARSMGIDPNLAIATAYQESGLSNAAVGDNGTSFGLFQLHQGGELGSMSPAQATNPEANARVALSQFAQTQHGG
ncbi:MAG: transglycosylase SLT domain-containing protein, partial [Terriglobia bacterium]